MALDRGLELQCVAPEALGSDADFVSPSVEHHSRSDHAADRTNGLVRRPSCVLLIVLWPEQGEKSAPRVQSTRLRKYQPGEEPNALRLREQGTGVPLCDPREADRSERAKLHPLGGEGGTHRHAIPPVTGWSPKFHPGALD